MRTPRRPVQHPDAQNVPQDARVLYYVPRYIARSEYFIWQQIRDLPNVRIAARYLTEHAPEFRHANVILLGPRWRPLKTMDSAATRVLRRLRIWRGRLSVAETLRLRSLLRDVDVVYTVFLWNAFDLLARPVASRSVPLVVQAGGSDVMIAQWRGEDYCAKVQRVFDLARLILCSSEFLRAETVRLGADPSRCFVHYLGVDIPEVVANTQQSCRTSPLQVVAVSRLEPVKGVHHTIEAFALALGGTDAQLTIIGDGSARQSLEARVSELGVGGRVRFLGSRSHAEVYACLKTADIFLQHSMPTNTGATEAFGASLAEASAHGLPVVASASGGTGEAIVHDETGYLVQPGDVVSMASYLSVLAESRELRVRMGSAGRRYVHRHFDSQSQTHRLAKRLQSVARDFPR